MEVVASGASNFDPGVGVKGTGSAVHCTHCETSTQKTRDPCPYNFPIYAHLYTSIIYIRIVLKKKKHHPVPLV